MKMETYRRIVDASFWLLLLTVIIWIVLWALPRTHFGADGDWVPYKIRKQYTGYSLPHGSLPYESYYGSNSSYGHSTITVQASNNSDLVVIIKEDNSEGRVINHAYLKAGGSYSFSMPNGTYQVFFYSGKDWYPEKEMKGGIKGGFLTNEQFSKDSPQTLNYSELTYSLVKRKYGNFHASGSNGAEAF